MRSQSEIFHDIRIAQALEVIEDPMSNKLMEVIGPSVVKNI